MACMACVPFAGISLASDREYNMGQRAGNRNVIEGRGDDLE